MTNTEFKKLYDELKVDEFRSIIKNTENYLERFNYKAEKLSFLKFLKQKIKYANGGSIYIHPDEVFEDTCFLSQFNNPNEIIRFFSYTLERHIYLLSASNSENSNDYYVFNLSNEYRSENNIKKLSSILFSHQYIDSNSQKVFSNILDGENIFEKKEYINFICTKTQLSFLLDDIFRVVFDGFNESDVLESGFIRLKGKRINPQSIYNSRNRAKQRSTSFDYQKNCEMISKILEKG